MKAIYMILYLLFMLSIGRANSFRTIGQRGSDTSSLSLKFSNSSIDKIFKEIERQSSYAFYYSQKVVEGLGSVSINKKKISLRSALDQLLMGSNVHWVIYGKNVVLRYDPSFILAEAKVEKDSVPQRAAISRLKIVVKNERGGTVENASILVGNDASISNNMGFVIFPDVFIPTIVQVTSIGYENYRSKLVANDAELVIVLKDKVTELKNVEVVSTGFQELDKNKITGSVYKIDNELFNRVPGNNVLDRIENVTSGLAPGVSGRASQGDAMLIRGSTSFANSGKPLIVLDNFPYEGDIRNINPNDVESITVLKDAAASAIWGTKSGNGVIVITSKKGRFNQKIKVGLTANTTLGDRSNIYYMPRISSFDMVDIEKIQFERGYYENYDDLYPQFGFVPAVSAAVEILLKAKKSGIVEPTKDRVTLAELRKLELMDNRENIYNSLQRTSLQQQYALNVSGGYEKSSFYASLGYNQDKAEVVGAQSKQITIDLKNIFKVTNDMEFVVGIFHSRLKNEGRLLNYQSLLSNSYSPYDMISDNAGNALAVPFVYRMTYVDTAKYPALYDWHYKPLEELNKNFQNNEMSDTRLNAVLRYRLLPWLRAEIQYQGQVTRTDNELINKWNSWTVRDGVNSTMDYNSSGQLTFPWPKGDLVERSFRSFKSWGARGSFSFDKALRIHRINGVIGLDYRQNTDDVNSVRMLGYDPNTNTFKPTNPLTRVLTRPGGGDIVLGQPIMPISRITRYGSVFANAIYSVYQRYFWSISGRVDQSNNFGQKANLRIRPLWSTGLSWNVSDEQFMRVNWISLLKLRASYGFTGQAVPSATSFATLRREASELYAPPRNGLVFANLVTPSNPGLRWERTKILNFGVDFALLNSRLTGIVEYYTKDGIDLIGPLPLDPTSGFSSYRGNGARIKGHGWDVSLNSKNITTSNFNWSTSLIFNYNSSRVISYDDKYVRTAGNLVSGNYDMIGYPLLPMFSYKWAGLDPIDGSPRILAGDTTMYFSELNNVTANDLKYSGTRMPKYTGSLINNFQWKQFLLSSALVYKLGYYFRRPSVNYSDLLGGLRSGHKDFGMRWRKKGDEITTDIPSIPEFPSFTRDLAYLSSDILVEKGDHIRLQDVKLTYVFDWHVLSKLKIVQSMSIYLYMSNIGILWKANNKGIDPEAFSESSLPTPKSYSFGLSANF